MTSTPSNARRILQEMRARGEATRPQLARACALSLVTVNRLVANLCTAGELEAAGEVSSGGGRPVQLYRLRRSGSWAALLRFSRAANGITTCALELLDPLGSVLKREEARFALLEAGTPTAWLDNILHHKRRLLGITLECNSPPLPPALCSRLAARYRCPCRLVNVADALAEDKDGSCTIVLRPAAAPQATLCRNSARQSCGELGLLPLPADWHTLDYSDHTLVEEMVARLLLTLACTLAPTRFVLHAPFWGERLEQRIRYNLSTKLRGTSPPPLIFRNLTPNATHDALRHLALEVRE